MEWWCQIGRQQMGPYSLAEVQTMVRLGQLTRQTFVRQGLTGTWQPAGNVPGFFSGSPQPGGPAPDSQPQYPSGQQGGYPQGGGYPQQGGPQQGYGQAAAPPTVIITQGGGAGEGLVWGLVGGLGLLVIAAVAFVFMYISDEQRDFLAKRNGKSRPAANRDGRDDGGSPSDADDEAPRTPAPGVLVDALDDDDELKEAVAFVVMGLRLRPKPGQVVEHTVGTGSGFAVSGDGYVLTNRHVTDAFKDPECEKVMSELKSNNVKFDRMSWVFFGRNLFEAEIVYVSDTHDLAVLKTDRRGGHYFRLAEESPRRGNPVTALGFPGISNKGTGQEDAKARLVKDLANRMLEQQAGVSTAIKERFDDRQFEFVLTDGKVGRTYNDNLKINWIEHSATINRGNSGGPLLSDDGRVVGINTLGLNDGDASTTTVYLSFSVPQIRAELRKAVPKVAW